MKRLYFVRHGESVMNVSGHWAGKEDTPLTKDGIKQAQKTGKVMKDKGLKIDLIICSPLSRALHTAEAIASAISYPLDKIVKDELFIERGFGDMEGKSYDEFMKTRTLKDMDNVNGAETVKDLQDRAVRALEYVQSLPQDNILIVSHGSFGRAFRRVIDNIPYHHEYSENWQKYYIGNAEIVELI